MTETADPRSGAERRERQGASDSDLAPQSGRAHALHHDASDDLLGPLSERPHNATIPLAQRVFCNRHLKMSEIAWVGFDMDYTLAIYDQEKMDELSIRATIDKLLARGYPEFIKELPPPTDFPVRGLILDKRYGHVLKVDRHKSISRGYHGLRELPVAEIERLYHGTRVRAASGRFHFVDTLYALSEVAVYAATVEAFERHERRVDFAKLFSDIRECIDEAHRDGTIVETMANDLPHYVQRDERLAQALHKMRSAGKKLFLLTNSSAHYTERMMTYLLGGQMAEYPSWKNYFDVVVAAARKPTFFREENESPFVEYLAPGKTRKAKLPFERGKLYEGGNLREFQRALGVEGGRVLYVGDHIYGDILRSKKESAWRTAMIIQELEQEVDAHLACSEDFEQLDRFAEARQGLEDNLRFYQQRFKELARTQAAGAEAEAQLEAERKRVKGAVDRIRIRLRQTNEQIDAIERRTDERFHPYWGSLLKERNDASSFGQQVDQYACVYTSRVSNFAHYSPQQTFRSPRERMPHELSG